MIDFAPPRLLIVYAVTDDNFNGSPWMPDGSASDFWAVVARANGHTKWRRVAIAAGEPTNNRKCGQRS
jgi:hypothetical protein